MISKKKKSLYQNNFGNQPSLQQSGLFSAKAQRQHLLDQLKKGTLFNFYPKNNHSSVIAHQPADQHREDNDWLSHIRLGGQEQNQNKQQSLTYLSKTQSNSKHFPQILSVANKKPKSYFLKSNRCGKLVCYQKKLQKCAAWNKQNPNCIDKNIWHFSESGQRNYDQLVSNDFTKIKGLNFIDRSFEESIMMLGSDASISYNNAFQNFSFMNSPQRNKKSRQKINYQRKAGKLSKLRDVEGHFVPSFLLEPILLDKQQKSSKSKK